jgi:PKD repeat protein
MVKRLWRMLFNIVLFIYIFNMIRVKGAEPPSILEITIPDYEVSKVADFDYVSIPGGYVLLVDGKPRVPYYSVSVDYPEGYRIQNVVERKRSGLETTIGLKLPIVMMQNRSSSNGPLSNESEGWYPREDYCWSIWTNPDGTTTLTIIIYPFYYNTETTEVRYYKQYEFDVVYIFSTVSILDVNTERRVYDPGEEITINVSLNNSGEARDIVAGALVRSYGSDKIVDGLPLITLQDVVGQASFSIIWNSKDFPTGDYSVEIMLNDTSGNWLDRRVCMFRLGRSMINVTGFSVEPQHFKIGDKIKISLEAFNTGSTTLNGKCIFTVQKGNSSVWSSYQNFSSLTPGASLRFTSTWDTSSAEKGALYYIVSYVSYESQTTLPAVVMVSTNYLPVARFSYTPTKMGLGEEVSFDASASSDPDGSISSYKWEFGDGGEGSGVSVKHSYNGLGDYIITLTVIDNEGGSNSTMKLIRVVMMYTLNVAVEIPGSGRYKEGDEVVLSAPRSASMPGLSGLLGAKYVFKQWVGFLNSTESSVKLVFTGYEPMMEMQAVYSEDYTGMMITVAIISLVIIAIIVLSLHRRIKRKPPPLPPQTSTSVASRISHVMLYSPTFFLIFQKHEIY